jgi:RTX calcium-binding nonapeptide repeat (4 copies)
MRITVSIAALTSLIALAAFGAAGANASVPVNLRVATNDGGNLADVTQYVPQKTTVKTFAGDDCLDPTPPFKQSSGASYPQSAPNMLSAIWEASQAEPALQPVRLSDADYASFGALSICQINEKSPPGFFALKANHQTLQVGADLFPVQAGDRLLAYRTGADFSVDEELDLSAPIRTTPGPVSVNVRSYTSAFSTSGSATIQPREGALVSGAGAPVKTDNLGNATLTFPTPGTYGVTATGDPDDIPSQTLTICVAANPDIECPDERGQEILGSDDAETIKGTDGDDSIKARDGDDLVKAAGGNDQIGVNGGGNDSVFCGDGFDTVNMDPGLDKAAKDCEVVNGATAKKCKKHKKKKNRAAEAKKQKSKCGKKKKGKHRK